MTIAYESSSESSEDEDDSYSFSSKSSDDNKDSDKKKPVNFKDIKNNKIREGIIRQLNKEQGI